MMATVGKSSLAMILATLITVTLAACDVERLNGLPIVGDASTLDSILANFNNGTALPSNVLATTKDGDNKSVNVYQGGFGSDAFVNPNNATQFYALTDRGPNADVVHGDTSVEQGEGKAFPLPTYTPSIGLFQIDSHSKITLIKLIELKRPDGTTKVTGLPNPVNGATKEIAYLQNTHDAAFGRLMLVNQTQPYNTITNPTKTDPYGLDPEGLAVMKDGTFWVSDEYGPHIVHLDANGRELARITPFDSGGGASTYKVNGKVITLPAEFKNRRANRGMEGLTITPDQKYLIGMMQSALYNPDKSTKKSTLTRILRIELATGKIEQFLYRQQDTSSDSSSGIVAIDQDNYYVIERDGDLPQHNANANAIKKVYKINLADGTNIEAIASSLATLQDEKLGLIVNGKTLEQQTLTDEGWSILASRGIRPVSKTEYLDAVRRLNYPHDKLEGLLLFPNGALGLINDDDFGITAQVRDNKDFITPKYINRANTDIDSNRLYIYQP